MGKDDLPFCILCYPSKVQKNWKGSHYVAKFIVPDWEDKDDSGPPWLHQCIGWQTGTTILAGVNYIPPLRGHEFGH